MLSQEPFEKVPILLWLVMLLESHFSEPFSLSQAEHGYKVCGEDAYDPSSNHWSPQIQKCFLCLARIYLRVQK